MSQQSVEDAFRRLVEGISNRDLALLQALSDPEIEYTSRFTAIEGKTYRGHAGWCDYLADLTAAWEEFRLTIEELVPAGEEKIMGSGASRRSRGEAAFPSISACTPHGSSAMAKP